MREAISGAWLYSLVLIFIVFLVGFVSISINYNKTYKLKTAVVNIIEQHQGVNDQSVANISQHLSNNGYLNGKVCRNLFKDKQKYIEIDKFSVSPVIERGDGDIGRKPAQVCISRSKYESPLEGASTVDYYYDVYLFFTFSLPIFGDIYKFNVMGTTNAIHYPVDTNNW